ncbi:PREDICTED: uncharacterized protein LOC109585783 [Amphimedon queenslandica]|uniref:Death domain-containing protein n=2 Tax=Amphimedon queenslandica TaxID=400682 RepID=A0AAN0JL66_AMPQE|nr:PREDICTED: uncharacterized protein LOC109585783 [Amphimedon queenslandica]|eukprot:XP_019857465.1 PREDICTED: uncharacterized protein LOC109585783 [Amphimedon queenslandica]
MASCSESCSPSVSLQTLSINDLDGVLQLLKDCDFSDKEWMTLGLKLGLTKSTLDSIEANHSKDVHRCLMECLSKWLQKADEAVSPTYNSLLTAAHFLAEATAEKMKVKIDQKDINRALTIFDKYYSKLLQSLSDPETMAYKLHKEGVFEQEVLERIESESSSISKQREILLDSLKEKMAAQYTCLETFITLLCKLTNDAKEGLAMKKDYEEFKSNGEIQSERQLEESQGLQNDSAEGSVFYTGVLYYQQKEAGRWEATLAVGKDAITLAQYIKSTTSLAEQESLISFKFKEPNGTLQLTMPTVGRVPCEYGWKVNPKQEPMKIIQSVVDNTLISSCSMSVHAKPDVATEPIHHPVKLLGIEPETTIYISRQPPSPAKEKVTRSNASILDENRYVSGVSSSIACDMIRKSSDDIKKNLKLTPSFIQSLIEREVIKEGHKDILNGSFHLTDDQRMDLFIIFVCDAINDDDDNFLFFLEAIREQNSRTADKVADDLKECHDDNYRFENSNEFDSNGQYLYDYINYGP